VLIDVKESAVKSSPSVSKLSPPSDAMLSSNYSSANVSANVMKHKTQLKLSNFPKHSPL